MGGDEPRISQSTLKKKKKNGGATELRTRSLAICAPNCHERAAEPGAQPGGGANVSTVPSLIPWGLPGRWFPCSILFALTQSQSLACSSCRFTAGLICWPHLSWQPLPRGLLPMSRNLALPHGHVSISLPWFSLSIVRTLDHCPAAQTEVQCHPYPVVAAEQEL